MRTDSGNNPHNPRGGQKEHAAYIRHEKQAVTMTDADDFLREIERLEAEGKKGTFANLGSSAFLEHARQVCRTAGQAEFIKGQGWRITDKGRRRLKRAEDETHDALCSDNHGPSAPCIIR